ncbi:MAG: ParM/StbA family protein [Chloroflexi bacterium]|nr:ParM/StbA family protein [Chloroflexota bacterium]
MTTEKTLLNLGFDPGNGALKFYGPRGGLQTLSQIAANGAHGVTRITGLRASKPPMQIQVDGRSFYVGEGAHDWGRPVESLDYERLTGTPEMIAMFCGALTRYAQAFGAPDVPLALTVGLPHEMMQGDDAKSNAAAVKSWMEGAHTWRADDTTYSTHVAEVRVTSQAVGALFDYLMDDEGKFVPARKAHFKSEVGVLSVGFNTVELLVVRNKTAVQRFTAGATVGVRRLLELVNRGNLYSLGELDTRLRAGQLDVVAQLPVWEREITGFVEKQWGATWRRFSAVLLVGGGAILLKDTLPLRFTGKAIVPDNPVLAIARGLCKLGLTQRKRTKAESQDDDKDADVQDPSD